MSPRAIHEDPVRSHLCVSQRLFLSVAVAILLIAGRAAAQDQPITCADWMAVQSWSGTVTYSGSGSGSDQNGNSESISESARIDFKTGKFNRPCDVNGDFSTFGLAGWSADATQTTYHVNLQNTASVPSTDKNNHPCTATINYDVSGGTSSNGGAQVDMNFTNATSGTHFVVGTQFVDGVQETIHGCDNTTSQILNTWQWGPTTFPARFGLPLPSQVGPLSGTVTFTAPGGLGEPDQLDDYVERYADHQLGRTADHLAGLRGLAADGREKRNGHLRRHYGCERIHRG